MSVYIPNASGNFSTSSIWDKTVNTPTLHATSNVNVSVAGINSATFTAENTSDSITGVLIFITSLGTSINWTVAHQEFDGATWNDVATETIASGDLYQWTATGHYIRFTTPYTPTTTTTDYQRIQLRVSATTGTPAVAQAASGDTLSYHATSSANATPTTNDDVRIAGNNGANDIVITVDGTANSIGSGATHGTSAFGRWLLACDILTGGTLIWDETADSTLTVKGSPRCWAGGTRTRGLDADNRFPIAYKARLLINPNGVSTNGVSDMLGAFVNEHGAIMTATGHYEAEWVSGLGTAASPLVISEALDLKVGDEIMVGPNTSGTRDRRYIITKNSATSYVVSSTLGGAETALSTHQTTSLIQVLERNVITASTNPSVGIWYNTQAGGTAATGIVKHSWTCLQYLNRGFSTQCGFGFSYGHVAGCENVCDYVVSREGMSANARHFVIPSAAGIPFTYNGLLGVDFTLTSGVSYEMAGANQTFNDCNGFGGFFQGTFKMTDVINVDGGGVPPYNNTFNRCKGFYGNQAGGQGGVWQILNNVNCNYNDCEANASAVYGVNVPGMNHNTYINNMKFGNRWRNNQGAIGFTNANAFIQGRINLNNPVFTDATHVDAYATRMSFGGLIAMQKVNGVENAHKLYTRAGTIVSTGAGLTDTHAFTAGHLDMRMSPENADTALELRTLIVAGVDRFIEFSGKVELNAAFVGDANASAVIEIWLPGATSAAQSYTVPKVTGVQVFSLAADYTGAVPLFGEARIKVTTATASAYAYFGDIYNGTNDISSLQLWYNGGPSPVMVPTLGDPQAVWAVPTSTMTVEGTVGKLQVDTEKKVDDNQALVVAR